MHRIGEYLSKRLDLLGGIVGCLIGPVFAYVGYATHRQDTIEMGLVILVTSVLYLLFRKRLTETSDLSFSPSVSLILLFNIIFISTLAASVLVMHISEYRPPIYYLLISLCVAAVAGEILCSKGRAQTWLLLLKILLIALSLRVGLYYEFPGFYGTDTWWHVAWIEEWINSGHIIYYMPTLDSYSSYINMPVMHLNIMATRIITGLNPKDSLFLSIGLFNVVSILFIFLLAQRLLGRKGGLLAALIAGVSRFHLISGVFLAPNGFGLTIYTMIIFLILRKRQPATNRVLIITLFLAMIFAHTVGSFITLVTLIVLLAANEVDKKLVRKNIGELDISYGLVFLFGLIMYMHWTYLFFTTAETRLVWVLKPFIAALSRHTEFVGLTSGMAASSWNRIGFLMLMGFIMLGSLIWLSPKMRNNLRVIIIALILVFGVLTFVFPVLNIRNLAASRWLPFIFVAGVGLVVSGILGLSAIGKSKIVKALLIVIIIFTFTMFDINNNSVNLHTPFVEEPSRYSYTQSEQSALDTISENYDVRIIGDRPFIHEYLETKEPLRPYGYLSELAEFERNNIIVIRRYAYTHLDVLEGMESDLLIELDGPDYDLIYRNPEVKAYFSRP